MSYTPNEVNDRNRASSGLNNSSGVVTEGGFEDPTGAFPRPEYYNSNSTNYAATGSRRNDLSLFSHAEGVDIDLGPTIPSEYPLNQVTETVSGHVIEIDDTQGNQRILIKHNSGSGIEIRQDGSIVISAKEQKIEVVGGESKLIVEGDADVVYKGNLNFRVNGDFNLDVKGNHNVNINSNRSTNITGSDRRSINGAIGDVVRGGYSVTSTQQATMTYLSGLSMNTKGSMSNNVDGPASYVASGLTTLTSEARINMSSADINIAASNLSAFGAAGTIGGEGIVYYGKGGTFEEGVTAPTFHGDLDGTADVAATSLHQSYSDGSGPGYSPSVGTRGTITNTATPTTAKPTASTLTDYLGRAAGGIRRVRIDIGDYIRNLIDRTVATGGVSSTSVDVGRARSRLRDPANRSNQTFVGGLLADRTICPEYSNPTPAGIGRVISGGVTPEPGETPIGSAPTSGDVFQPSSLQIALVPEHQYNPLYAGEITSSTKLAPGITLSKFLGSDDPTNINFIRDNAMRAQIAKYYYLHAQIIKTVQTDTDRFNDYTLTVSEGLYRPGPTETVTPGSINDLRLKGRAVGYKLLDRSGRSNPIAMFNLAAYLKSKIYYDKMILSYDTIDCKLNCTLIIIMPEVNDNWEGLYLRTVETELNGVKLSQGELVEVLERPSTGSSDTQGPYSEATDTEWYTWAAGVDRRVSGDLLSKIEAIGRQFGSRLVINSGYRDPGRNARAGGASGSQHLNGLAVDILTSGLSQNEVLRLIRIASAQGITGIGVYSGSVHFDIRAEKTAWGPTYRRASVPSWAEQTIRQHLTA